MNHQSFTILQFAKLLKSSFHSMKIELKDTTGEKNPCVRKNYFSCFLVQQDFGKSF